MIGISGRDLASDSAILKDQEEEDIYLSDIEVQAPEYYQK
jgi:hypothetical protein